jgi:16S rRNA (uracil1498-N3)-methyltransferase
MSRMVRVALDGLVPGRRELSRPVSNYLCAVHRLEAGELFIAFDPERAEECEARLIDADRRGATAELSEVRAAANRGGLDVTLLQGIGKGDKLEDVVRLATALGAKAVCFVSAERSVARPSDERAARLRSVAIEAARQSGRGDIPSIEGPSSLAHALEPFRDAGVTRLCLDPRADTPLASRLREPCVLLIGPEGGWSADEIADASAAGFERVAIGPLTLRTELAAAAALGCFAARLAGAPP